MSTASQPTAVQPMKPDDNLESIASINCAMGVDRKDLGSGRLELLKSRT
jgi:hypothetical protein